MNQHHLLFYEDGRHLQQMVTEEGHIFVTVPEHRLSLENKAMELSSDQSHHTDLKAAAALQQLLLVWGVGS